MTRAEIIRCYIRNDERNVRDVERFPTVYENVYRVIADCALHLFMAERLNESALAYEAEGNLLDALNVAGMNVGDKLMDLIASATN